jgi:hypothetical protein
MPHLGRLPSDIPAKPDNTYANKGWAGMGDWLGTGTIAVYLRKYRPFAEARAFSRKLNLKTGDEWTTFCKGKMPELGQLPADIPATPEKTYADKGWAGMGDWLGTGTIAPQLRQFRAFEQSRGFVRSLGLKSQWEWYQFSKGMMSEKGTMPADIPAAPQNVYENNGWINWGDWLGTGAVADHLRQYRPFHQARDFIRSLGLMNNRAWMRFKKGELPEKGTLPPDIPACPEKTYAKKGWAGMGDWLGTGVVAPRLRQYRPFKEARAFVHSLAFKNRGEWVQFCEHKLPSKGDPPHDIPLSPWHVYADQGWAGMGDWLGTGVVASHLRQYRSFEQARAFARSLGFKGTHDWFQFCKGEMPEKGRLPPDISSCPNQTYAKKGWINWGDWLGTGSIATWLRKYRPFPEARAFARNLKLKSGAEWIDFCHGKKPNLGRLPVDIPAAPNKAYKGKGWASMGDWLGTGRIASHLIKGKRGQCATP